MFRSEPLLQQGAHLLEYIVEGGGAVVGVGPGEGLVLPVHVHQGHLAINPFLQRYPVHVVLGGGQNQGAQAQKPGVQVYLAVSIGGELFLKLIGAYLDVRQLVGAHQVHEGVEKPLYAAPHLRHIVVGEGEVELLALTVDGAELIHQDMAQLLFPPWKGKEYSHDQLVLCKWLNCSHIFRILVNLFCCKSMQVLI